jgi:uncharacterized protein YndB with AHSA1/START domain
MTTVEPLADRQIVTTRLIGGPRRLVFAAYTSAEHLGAWWGPNGFTTTTYAFEFKPGGIWHYMMHGPDGVDYPNWIQWREIVPNERIDLIHGESATDPDMFESEITFADEAGGTRVTMTATFKTRARRDFLIEHFGVIEGGKQTLGRLGGYVEAQVAAS